MRVPFVFVLFMCDGDGEEIDIAFIDVFMTSNSAYRYANTNFGTPLSGWEPMDEQNHSWLSSDGDFLVEQRAVYP